MSRPYKAEDADLLIAKETDQGTIVIPDRRLGVIVDDVDLPDPAIDHDEEYIVGAGRKAGATTRGQTNLDGGSISVKPTDTLPFEMLLQSESSSGTIVLGEGKNDAVSTTLQAIYDDSNKLVRTFSGVVAGSGEITVDDESDLVVDLDIDALDVATDEAEGTSSQGIINQPTWSFTDTASNLSIFGAEFSRLNDFSLEIDNGTEVQHYVTSDTDEGKPFEITLGNAEVNLSATITVSNSDIYDELLDGSTEFASNIIFDNGTNQLSIEVSGCKIREAPHEIPEEGVVEVDVDIVARNVAISISGTTA